MTEREIQPQNSDQRKLAQDFKTAYAALDSIALKLKALENSFDKLEEKQQKLKHSIELSIEAHKEDDLISLTKQAIFEATLKALDCNNYKDIKELAEDIKLTYDPDGNLKLANTLAVSFIMKYFPNFSDEFLLTRVYSLQLAQRVTDEKNFQSLCKKYAPPQYNLIAELSDFIGKFVPINRATNPSATIKEFLDQHLEITHDEELKKSFLSMLNEVLAFAGYSKNNVDSILTNIHESMQMPKTTIPHMS